MQRPGEVTLQLAEDLDEVVEIWAISGELCTRRYPLKSIW